MTDAAFPTPDNTVVSKHAMDRASLRCMERFLNRSNKKHSLSKWIRAQAIEIRRRGDESGPDQWNFNGLTVVMKWNDYGWSVLTMYEEWIPLSSKPTP